MQIYYYIAIIAIVTQILFLIQTARNYRYAMQKYKKDRSGYRPKTVLIVPCKGIDRTFEENISSFYFQDYDKYLLWFVVGEKSDSAYKPLCKLKETLEQKSKASEVKIHIAGNTKSCSQKIHNLLYCYEKITADIEVMAFADSDICIKANWLSHLVYPLRHSKIGAASGYRWFVPQKNNLATLALSAINAKIAQMLGNTTLNQLWGGSMAIKVDVFKKIGMGRIWKTALSDDLSLSIAVKKNRLIAAFVPACLVASYEKTTWSKLFEFARRQFLITRINAPKTWLFALVCTLYSVLGIWATAAIAIFAHATDSQHIQLFYAVPATFIICQMLRAVVRQKMAAKLLSKDLPKLKYAIAADILGFWIWSILMLTYVIASAFGRTIKWRGIKYKLISPTETIIIDS